MIKQITLVKAKELSYHLQGINAIDVNEENIITRMQNNLSPLCEELERNIDNLINKKNSMTFMVDDDICISEEDCNELYCDASKIDKEEYNYTVNEDDFNHVKTRIEEDVKNIDSAKIKKINQEFYKKIFNIINK